MHVDSIKRTVRLAFRAIFYTQSTVRLIGILVIFTNSTFNRNAGHLVWALQNFQCTVLTSTNRPKDCITDSNIKEICKPKGPQPRGHQPKGHQPVKRTVHYKVNGLSFINSTFNRESTKNFKTASKLQCRGAVIGETGETVVSPGF